MSWWKTLIAVVMEHFAGEMVKEKPAKPPVPIARIPRPRSVGKKIEPRS